MKLPIWAQTAGGSLIAVLFAGNVFFVSRLVDQLDATREIVWKLRQEIVILSMRVDSFPKCRSCEGAR